MPAPRAIVFDLGKVLVDFDYTIAIRAIGARSKATAGDIARFLLHTTAMVEFETGLIGNEEFFQRVRDALGYQGDFAEFADSFGDIFSPIEPMIEFQARMKGRGMPTYIFSNTNDLAVRNIRSKFPFFGGFDGYVYSYEQRAMKPDAKIYEVVERMSGCLGAELLFIDDRADNVAAGAQRGWQTILQESPEKTLAAARMLGL